MWVSRKKKVQTVSKAMVSVTVVKGLTCKSLQLRKYKLTYLRYQHTKLIQVCRISVENTEFPYAFVKFVRSFERIAFLMQDVLLTLFLEI